MKKKLILILPILISIIGCNNNNITSAISNEIKSEIISNEINNNLSLDSSSINQSSIVFEESSSLNNESILNSSIVSDSEIKQEEKITSIKQIKEIAKEYTTLKNNVGVYESNINVELDLKLLACLDAITTKKGYGNKHKLLMSDGTNYIYVKTTESNYNYLKDYVNDQSTYKVSGNISLYNDEVEITNSIKPTYLPNKQININYENIEEKSLPQIYNDLYSLTLNCKGVAFSKIIKTKVKCIAKDINNSNMYFANNDKIIMVHGHDKVTNKFTAGSSYLLYGALSMYNFRPSLEYVYSSALQENINFDTSSLTKKTAADFYNYKYEVDKDANYPNYSKLFETPYIIDGYPNIYLKDNKEYMVFEDNYTANIYETYQQALNKKAVFIVNENYVKLTQSNNKYCPLYEYLSETSKVQIIVFPYLWNTNKYPQVYCYGII